MIVLGCVANVGPSTSFESSIVLTAGVDAGARARFAPSAAILLPTASKLHCIHQSQRLRFSAGDDIDHNLFSPTQVASRMLAVHPKCTAAVQELGTIIAEIVTQSPEHDQVTMSFAGKVELAL